MAVQTTEWRLPSTDPRDEGKYLFRLHTLDVYFWTKEDASLFVQHCQHTLRPQQLNLDFPTINPHSELASPVVQKLENMAVSDPAYQRSSRASVSTNVASPATSTVTTDDHTRSAEHTPLPYNPSAPPAPEKRVHREKTPPPPEEPGFGLTHAATEEHHQPITSVPGMNQHTPGGHQPYTGIPISNPYSPVPSSHGVSSPRPSSTSTAPTSVPASHSYVPASKNPLQQQQQQLHSSHPSIDSPTTQILGSSYLTSPTVPLQHIQPQYADYLAQHQTTNTPPPGGYSNYSYNSSTPGQQQHRHHNYHPSAYYPTSTGDQDIHSQVYQPTEHEAHGKPPKGGQAGPGAANPGRWEQKAEKAEKSLNRFLRKVEKKVG
jgi:hypothetical protein